MTFLTVIRTIRSIEIGLARYRKRKAHLTVSRYFFLYGITGKNSSSLQWHFVSHKLSEMYNLYKIVSSRRRNGDAHKSFRRTISKKVQPLMDGSRAQKAFLLLLAHCKGWTWLASSFSSHMAWAGLAEPWRWGVLPALLVSASCWASWFS